jgi:alanine dehydrogenase
MFCNPLLRLIKSVLIPGTKAPQLVTRDMLKSMKNGAFLRADVLKQ